MNDLCDMRSDVAHIKALIATQKKIVMSVTIDLTHGELTEFSGSSEEDINYAKTFWQSVHLQPPVESRLVSSDIKQRLRIAPSGSQSMNKLLIYHTSHISQYIF